MALRRTPLLIVRKVSPVALNVVLLERRHLSMGDSNTYGLWKPVMFWTGHLSDRGVREKERAHEEK